MEKPIEFNRADDPLPPVGTALIVWKWARNRDREKRRLIKLRIPAGARRLKPYGGVKCRAEYARVLEIWSFETNSYSLEPNRFRPVETAHSWHEHDFVYRVGSMVRAHEFDPDPHADCSGGIHFFLTRERALRLETQ